jgi:hypothetical protein
MAKAFRHQRAAAKNLLDLPDSQYTGDAGKDKFDGICNFAGYGC